MEINELVSVMQDRYGQERFPMMLESLRRKIVKGLIPGVTEQDLNEAIERLNKDEIEIQEEEEYIDSGLLLEEIYETENFLRKYEELYGEPTKLEEDYHCGVEPIAEGTAETGFGDMTLEEILGGANA